MEIINQLITFISKLLDWWVVVMPWEQAIFVRGGKKVKVLRAGWYFKIPFVDYVYPQTIRLRMMDVPMQTLSTLDGTTVSIKMAIGYSIGDIFKLYNSLSHPETTLQTSAMGAAAEYITQRAIIAMKPKELEEYVESHLRSKDWGLKDLSVKMTSQVSVKTYRLLQDQGWISEGLNLDGRK